MALTQKQIEIRVHKAAAELKALGNASTARLRAVAHACKGIDEEKERVRVFGLIIEEAGLGKERTSELKRAAVAANGFDEAETLATSITNAANKNKDKYGYRQADKVLGKILAVYNKEGNLPTKTSVLKEFAEHKNAGKARVTLTESTVSEFLLQQIRVIRGKSYAGKWTGLDAVEAAIKEMGYVDTVGIIMGSDNTPKPDMEAMFKQFMHMMQNQ